MTHYKMVLVATIASILLIVISQTVTADSDWIPIPGPFAVKDSPGILRKRPPFSGFREAIYQRGIGRLSLASPKKVILQQQHPKSARFSAMPAYGTVQGFKEFHIQQMQNNDPHNQRHASYQNPQNLQRDHFPMNLQKPVFEKQTFYNGIPPNKQNIRGPDIMQRVVHSHIQVSQQEIGNPSMSSHNVAINIQGPHRNLDPKVTQASVGNQGVKPVMGRPVTPSPPKYDQQYRKDPNTAQQPNILRVSHPPPNQPQSTPIPPITFQTFKPAPGSMTNTAMTLQPPSFQMNPHPPELESGPRPPFPQFQPMNNGPQQQIDNRFSDHQRSPPVQQIPFNDISRPVQQPPSVPVMPQIQVPMQQNFPEPQRQLLQPEHNHPQPQRNIPEPLRNLPEPSRNPLEPQPLRNLPEPTLPFQGPPNPNFQRPSFDTKPAFPPQRPLLEPQRPNLEPKQPIFNLGTPRPFLGPQNSIPQSDGQRPNLEPPFNPNLNPVPQRPFSNVPSIPALSMSPPFHNPQLPPPQPQRNINTPQQNQNFPQQFQPSGNQNNPINLQHIPPANPAQFRPEFPKPLPSDLQSFQAPDRRPDTRRLPPQHLEVQPIQQQLNPPTAQQQHSPVPNPMVHPAKDYHKQMSTIAPNSFQVPMQEVFMNDNQQQTRVTIKVQGPRPLRLGKVYQRQKFAPENPKVLPTPQVVHRPITGGGGPLANSLEDNSIRNFIHAIRRTIFYGDLDFKRTLPDIIFAIPDNIK